jgi:hypothetical protein
MSSNDTRRLLQQMTASCATLVLTPPDPEYTRIVQNAPHMPVKDYLRKLLAAETSQFGQQWAAFKGLADVLVAIYLKDESSRQPIRDFVFQSPQVGDSLLKMIEEQSWVIDSQEDQGVLEKLLALFSILDEGEGLGQENLFSLSRIYNLAADAGFDFNSVIQRVADISNDIPRYQDPRSISTKAYLMEFEPLEGM